jgi:hypothetical protein
MFRILLFSLSCLTGIASLRADTVTITGNINQAIEDGTGPAVNNPSLNSIHDGAAYTVNLSFTGSITSPGTFNLNGLSILFGVPSAGSTQNSFDSASLTVAQSGAFDQVSILACLTTGSACNQGNELDLNFSVLPTNLNVQNAAAQEIAGLLPLDLLEDDGVTDIHGSVNTYSYIGASPVPEPVGMPFVATGLLAAGLLWTRWSSKNRPN